VTTWDPQKYAGFWDLRRRPALDLIARLPQEPAPRRILDLGCGPGTVTTLLADRWPDAEIVGVDSSTEMLADARALLPDVTWVEGDLTAYQPEAGDVAPDLVFTNAALHWVPDHETLIPRLFGFVAPGGRLAIQVPDKWDQPSHTLGFEIADQPRWRDRLDGAIARNPLLDEDQYLDLLLPVAADVDLWTTTYHHVLDGPDPVVEWFLGSFLRAFLSRLDDAEGQDFVALYAAAMRAAYPARDDGRTVMPFQRLFIVARANP
jgi:trans-aconitate 2-methyltransferase